MYVLKKVYCRTMMGIFYIIKPFLPYRVPETLKTVGDVPEVLPQMAKHTDREANPLYAVPTLWDARELEPFYEKIADWGRKNDCSRTN